MDNVDAIVARVEREGTTCENIEALLVAAAYAPDESALTVAEYRTLLRRLVNAGLMAVCAGCSIAFVPRNRHDRFHSAECRLWARHLHRRDAA